MTASLALRIDGAEKRFDETLALDGASLTLERGEWLALLGPNGAGKTTLVRSVTDRVRLDSGSIELLGQDLDGSPAAVAARHKLGLVPQEIALYPLLSAAENLRLWGELSGSGWHDLGQRIEWALEWTGLEERRHDRVGTFSGGMKRRLNIACGVLHQPEVILLDEPTVGVDPQSRERIWEMLGELRDAGAALLLTTHQLDEAQKVADHIVIIDHGLDIANGDFQQLVRDTIGPGRRVTLQLAEPVAPPAGLTLEGSCLRGTVSDVAGELPALLQRVAGAGGRIIDVEIDAPSLQAVFIHLTGRELRE
ncbi:MAG: ABC transporter ATP-binding protein [Acidobacteria bacterium]|nr:ABC transporter ATP-binding protein [Acidobacteriota bacterium]